MSSPSYESQERQFVFATLGLIAALVVIGAVVIGISSEAGQSTPTESGGGADPESPTAEQAPGSEVTSTLPAKQTTTTAAPEDLTFLCDIGLELPEGAEIPSDQEDAARSVAQEFARAAYGYTGDDAEGYESAVEEMVVEECFWPSVAGDDVEAMEEMVQLGGEQNAAEDQVFLEEYVGFYIEEERQISQGQEYPLLTGVAVWVSRTARTEMSMTEDLTGRQQRLTLVRLPVSGEWTVVEGESPTTGLAPEYERAAEEKAEEIVSGGS